MVTLNLSAECFYDYCGDCHDPQCRDWCHEDEDFDFMTGEWVEREEEEADGSFS